MTNMLDHPTVAIDPFLPKPRHRGRKIAIIAAILVGLPAVAFAASFLFATLTGSTTVTTGNQDMRIAAVTGTTGPEGVSCVGSTKTDSTHVALAPRTSSMQITTDGGAVQNGPVQVITGQCTVDVLVENNGPLDVNVATAVTPPTGWTIAAPQLFIAKESQGHLIVTVTALPTATAGAITGSLSLSPEHA
jgi:hypothetical protein